jgi:hypothetical protein
MPVPGPRRQRGLALPLVLPQGNRHFVVVITVMELSSVSTVESPETQTGPIRNDELVTCVLEALPVIEHMDDHLIT